jgi:hypothetical protein
MGVIKINKMKRFDNNGQSLSLLFAGEDSYKTRLGGVVSVFVKMVVFTYAYGQITQLAKKEDPSLTTT